MNPRLPLHPGTLAALALAAALTSLAASDPDAPWPTFHGPRRDNISGEAGLLRRWPKDGPPLLWKASGCGQGYSAVAAAEGLLFLSGDFGDQEFVLALDREGRLRWKTPHGKAWKGAQPGARTTPTYDHGRVYHLGPHGSLSAFEAGTGRTVWTVDVCERFESSVRTWGYTENLLIDGDRLLLMPGGVKGRVVALDKNTGRTLWANTEITDRAAYSSPIVAEHGGVRQLIALARSTVLGVDVQTGKLLWSHEHESTCDQNVTSPIYHDGCVFVTSGHLAGARVVRLSADSRRAEQVWFGTRLDNCHGGVVLRDGCLYGSGCRLYNKGLLCVEFATGKIRYQAKEIGKVSLTQADGLLYCYDNDGEMLLVDATPEQATIVSRFKVPRIETTEHTLTHPVVCEGRLYLRHLDELFAYEIRAH